MTEERHHSACTSLWLQQTSVNYDCQAAEVLACLDLLLKLWLCKVTHHVIMRTSLQRPIDCPAQDCFDCIWWTSLTMSHLLWHKCFWAVLSSKQTTLTLTSDMVISFRCGHAWISAGLARLFKFIGSLSLTKTSGRLKTADLSRLATSDLTDAVLTRVCSDRREDSVSMLEWPQTFSFVTSSELHNEVVEPLSGKALCPDFWQ